MKLFALLGRPVTHSLSPEMHRAAFAAAGIEAEYLRIDCGEQEMPRLAELVRRGPISGANITVPHKLVARELADEASAEADRLGAANTWTRQGGRLVAHNTDGAGSSRTEESDDSGRNSGVASVIMILDRFLSMVEAFPLGGLRLVVLAIAAITHICIGVAQGVIEQANTAGGLLWNEDRSRGEWQQGFTVVGIPPMQAGHRAWWRWTFSGCDPIPAAIEHSDPEPIPPVLVTFLGPGKCPVTYSVRDLDDPSYHYEVLGDFFVIGGPYTVTLNIPLDAAWIHDDMIESSPWFLDYFGYDPGLGAKPEYAQDVVTATIVAEAAQPLGTEYWWSYPENATLVPADAPNESAQAQSIVLAAKGASAVRGDIEVALEYRLPLQQAGGAVYVYTSVDYAGEGTPQGPNYRRFTSHAPDGTGSPAPGDLAHKHVDVVSRQAPWSCIGKYWYRVYDQFAVPLPRVYVQERFPGSLPGGFQVNTDGIGWVTLAGQWPDAAPWSLGRFDMSDDLSSGAQANPWTYVAHPNNPLFGPFDHMYFGGTLATAFYNLGGIACGSYSIRIWTDKTLH